MQVDYFHAGGLPPCLMSRALHLHIKWHKQAVLSPHCKLSIAKVYG